MALLTLFSIERGKIAAMELDCVISEDHELSAQVSRSAVEHVGARDANLGPVPENNANTFNGTDVTDNVVIDPKRLKIHGVVSKHPIGIGALAASAANAAVTAGATQLGASAAIAGGAASLSGLVTSGLQPGFDGDGQSQPKSREPSDVWAYLEYLFTQRVPFTVVTGLKQYPNMILTNLKAPRTSKTVNTLEFTAMLEQIQIADTKVGSYVPTASDVADGAAEKANVGKQTATEASSKVADDSSIAFQIGEATGVVGGQ